MSDRGGDAQTRPAARSSLRVWWGLRFFYKQRRSNHMLYSEKQNIDETSVGLAGHVEEGDE